MIEIRKVSDKKGLKKFVRYVNELYKECEQWVPSLEFDEMATLRKDKNPAFAHCEAEYWLAYRDGEIVGRIAGIINHKANEKWGNKVRFGWFDFINDVEVASALVKTVEEWGKSKGMTGIHGPLGFNDMDKEGLLVEGFDNIPTIATLYNYPYYMDILEKLGFTKAEDWLQYKLNLGNKVPDKIVRVHEIISKRYPNLRAVTFKTKKEIKKYAIPLFHTLNAAFANLYGYSELTDDEIKVIVGNYFSFIDPRFVSLVFDENDNVVAFGISMASLSTAYQKAKGKLFPFGFIPILKALRKKNFETIDLYLNGVLPEWQNKGIHALYYTSMNQAYIDNHIPYAITNPQLESNINAVHIWNNYDIELYNRRRCYTKEID